jgi:hypothetical protein
MDEWMEGVKILCTKLQTMKRVNFNNPGAVIDYCWRRNVSQDWVLKLEEQFKL